MKHLANCTNTEFLKQALLVRQPLRDWLETTGAGEIRARKPEGWDAMTDEQREAARDERIAQARANTADIIHAALEKDFDGTVRLLSLVTFTAPEEFDDNPLSDYLYALQEMLQSRRVVDFFTLYL